MPKYIDLLRAHGARKTPPDSPPEAPDEHWLVEEAEQPAHAAKEESQPAELLEEEPVRNPEPPAEHTASGIAPAIGEDADDEQAWLEACVRHALDVFRRAAADEPADLKPLRNAVTSLLASEQADGPDRLERLERIMADHPAEIRKRDDDVGDLVEKSIMMMIYAIKMGRRLRLNDDELLALVLAGMLHHVGMARVSTDIRHKKKKLTREERKEIADAPARGAAWLKEKCGVHDERILTAAAQARERFDGSGPQGLKEHEISRTARIIGLLSMFEAMIHYRAYRKRLLPRDAIREILIHHKQSFDPAFLKCLIDAISLYPVGTYVQLNSGDIGQVIHVHQRLPLRPVVRLTLDRHGNGIVPRTVDLSAQPNLMVERCMYPEDIAEISQHTEQAAG